MDNIVTIKIGEIEYEFKLKSSSILYLEKKLNRNIFEAFQNPDFTVMCNIFYACANDACKLKYKNEGDLFDALLAEYNLEKLTDTYLSEIVQKSGLVQRAATTTPSEEVSEKTWNK